MTYNSRPLYGIKESFFGPAAYREAEFQQSIKPQPTQALSVGDSKTKATIEGYEQTQYPQAGTKQELMGAGIVAYAQAFQKFTAGQKAPEYEAITFTSTTTYTPAFESGVYYASNEQSAVALTEQPAGWGTGTFYTRSGEEGSYVFTPVAFTSTTTYSPEFAENTYYKKEGEEYVLLSSQPEDWGTGTYYKVKEAE